MTDDAKETNSELDDLDAQLDALLNDIEASDEALKDARVEDESTLDTIESLVASASDAPKADADPQGTDDDENAVDDEALDFDKLTASVAAAQQFVSENTAEAVAATSDDTAEVDEEAAHAMADLVLRQAREERAAARPTEPASAPAAPPTTEQPPVPQPIQTRQPLPVAQVASANAGQVETANDPAAHDSEPQYNDAASLKAALDDMFAELEGNPSPAPADAATAVAEAAAPANAEVVEDGAADVLNLADSLSNDELQAQLDALLSGDTSEETIDTAQQLIDDTKSANANDAAALAAKDDDLVSQIQELLDDARAAQADIDDAYDKTDQTDSDVDAVDARPSATVEKQPGSAKKADAEPQADAALDEIDTLLAEQAEEAIDGDFDTPEDVLAAERPAPRVAGREEGVDDDVMPMHIEEPDMEGSFDTPDVIEATAEQSGNTIVGLDDDEADHAFDASADDVAAELDSQPELSTKKRKPAAPKAAEPAPAQTGNVRQRLAELARNLHPTRLGEQTQTLKSVCEAVNSPLERVSPSTRDMIGYIGLITIFNAGVLIAWRVAMSLLA